MSLTDRSLAHGPSFVGVDADVHGWPSTGYVKFKPTTHNMKHMFEWISTIVTVHAIVQVFDEHMFDTIVWRLS